MDEDDQLRSNAQKAEEKAAIENQQKVAHAREGSARPQASFDSAVLDAWTAGIETPHGFKSSGSTDEVKRVETPQEHLFDIIKKEDDKKKQVAEEARAAEAKQISIEEERKQQKAAQAAKTKVESDYEMPQDVDDDIKDLYSDTMAKSSSAQTEEKAVEKVESKPIVAEAPKPVEEAPKVEAAPVEAPKPVAQEQAPKTQVDNVDPLGYSVLTDHLSSK